MHVPAKIGRVHRLGGETTGAVAASADVAAVVWDAVLLAEAAVDGTSMLQNPSDFIRCRPSPKALSLRGEGHQFLASAGPVIRNRNRSSSVRSGKGLSPRRPMLTSRSQS